MTRDQLLNAMRDPGLSRTAVRVLTYLIDRGGIAHETHGQIAEALGVSRATVTQALARLERSGYVSRQMIVQPRVAYQVAGVAA